MLEVLERYEVTMVHSIEHWLDDRLPIPKTMQMYQTRANQYSYFLR
jgi:hypothetical protein